MGFLLLVLLSTCVLGHEAKGVPAHELTDVFAVHLKAGADANQVAAEHGYRNLGQIGKLEGFFRFEKLARPPRGVKTTQLDEHEHVEFAEAQVLRKRFPRALESIHDPLWNRQWALHGRPVSMEVEKVWQQLNITGRNVQIAIVDDGLDHVHPDLSANYAPVGSRDINYNKADPKPFSYDGHGTSAAGCCSAAANNVCGLGTAPQSRVAGIRLIAKSTTDADEAEGLSYHPDVNHIMSSSWGPYDDAKRLEGPGYVLYNALKHGVATGRNGKGTIYMWAGGNGRGAHDNGNYDGYANNRYTIPVGAIVAGGKNSWYSEPCACLYCVVPSSGGSAGGITSTALNNRCTSSFGGTSAASPLMAGVVALVLEANPGLTWRDVMHVIANSAVKVDPNNADWVVNGGGFHHSHNYGFGRIDALQTVTAAKNWVNVPAELPAFSTAQVTVSKTFSSQFVTGEVVVSTDIDFVEHIDIWFQADHPHRGKVEVYLESPYGTRSTLAESHGDMHSNYPAAGWKFGSVRHWGEDPNHNGGKWKVACRASSETGKFNFFKLVFYGYKKTAQ